MQQMGWLVQFHSQIPTCTCKVSPPPWFTGGLAQWYKGADSSSSGTCSSSLSQDHSCIHKLRNRNDMHMTSLVFLGTRIAIAVVCRLVK